MQLSVLSPYFLDTLCEPKAQAHPSRESRVRVLQLHPPHHQQWKATPPPPASTREQTSIVPAGGQGGCVNVPLHGAFCGLVRSMGPAEDSVSALHHQHKSRHQTITEPQHHGRPVSAVKSCLNDAASPVGGGAYCLIGADP